MAAAAATMPERRHFAAGRQGSHQYKTVHAISLLDPETCDRDGDTTLALFRYLQSFG
jgi:hypothetical protein